MDEKIKVECLIWLLIRSFGTQKAVAKAIGIRPQKMNYWLNYSQTVSAHYLSVMLNLLRSREGVLPDSVMTLNDVVGRMPLSTLAQWAMAKLEKGAKYYHQAQIKNNSTNNLNCQNFDKKTKKNPRFDDEIANQYGFGNRSTLYHAIAVIKNGCPELIAAMDNRFIKIYPASRLSKLSMEQQQKLIAQGKDAIKAYLKPQKPKNRDVKEIHLFDLTKALARVHEHQALIELEQETELPLRKMLEAILVDACV